MNIYEVLRRPVLTEKSDVMREQSKYTFEVDRRATKIMVKQAVEAAFNVKVVDVNIINVPATMGRYGRRKVISQPAWKKAIVTLAPGDKITFFEGV
ncbi:MAG: 50S ribosomal protein L23 [Anaerolineae bacterium]